MFRSGISAKSITKVCEKKSSMWKGREVVVVDTPGIFDTEVPCAEMRKEIARCILLTSPGPHALLLVLPVGRYTLEEHRAVEEMLKMFPDTARKHMILLFTRKDGLRGASIRDYLQEGLGGLVSQFPERYCAFNNMATGAEQEKQREELLKLVQRVVMENDGRHYTDEMYQKAEEEIQKRVQMVQERDRTELEEAKRQIRVQYEEEIRILKDEMEQEKRRALMMVELAKKEEMYALREQNIRDQVMREKEIFQFILGVLKFTAHIFSIVFKDK